MNQIKIGSILNFASIGLNSCIGILFTPLLLRSMGQAEYGLYQLIGAFAGYLALLDFGIQSTAIRYIAKYRAKNDSEGEESFLFVILLIYAFMSVLLCVISTILYFNMDDIFSATLSGEQIDKAKVMFLVLSGSMVVLLIGKTFNGAIQGRGRFIFANSIYLTLTLAKVVGWVIVLILGFGSIGLVIITGIVNLTILASSAFYVLFILKVKIKLHRNNFPLFREIFSFSAFAFLIAITYQVNFGIGNLILGILAGAAAVAPFAVAMQLFQIFYQIGCVIPSLFLPETTRLVANGAKEKEIIRFVVQPSRYSLMILAPAVIAFGLFGKRFILLWAGAEYANAWIMAFSIMMVNIVTLPQLMMSNILRAQGRLAFQAWTYFIATVLNVLISIAAAYWIGESYVVVGLIVAMVIGHIAVMNIYYYFRVGLDVPYYFRHLLHRLWIVFAVSTIAGGLNYLFICPTWGNLGVSGIVFIALYLLVLWLIGINRTEKVIVAGYAQKIVSFFGYRP